MRIIALDLASTTGFAVGATTGPADDSGSLDFRLGKGAGKCTGKSFYDFYEWLDDLIQAQLIIFQEPITLVYERPLCNFYNTVRVAHGFATVVQMLEGKYLDKGVVCTNVPPTSIKKFWTGNGRADKKLMLATAREQYPQCGGHDQADALAILHFWQEVYDG